MKWLRSKPADANELDEAEIWAEGQRVKAAAAAGSGAAVVMSPADAEMPDQSQDGVAGEEMEGVTNEGAGKAGKGRRRENGDAEISGGTAVRAGGGGG